MDFPIVFCYMFCYTGKHSVAGRLRWVLLRRLSGQSPQSSYMVHFLEAEQAMHDEPSQDPQTPAPAEAARAPSATRLRCLMVGMGASAGGLEAFEQFFTRMPPESGMAFVLVQHLAPDHASPCRNCWRGTPGCPCGRSRRKRRSLQPGLCHPAECHADNRPRRAAPLSPPVEPRGHRTPIDSFFRSLAEDQGENAVCILLSGTGTDGTLGLRAVKEYGGMAMAQTPESAQYDSIIRSAIATGLVDHILPVEEMPAKLLEYAAHLTALVRPTARSASARRWAIACTRSMGCSGARPDMTSASTRRTRSSAA